MRKVWTLVLTGINGVRPFREFEWTDQNTAEVLQLEGDSNYTLS